jgi:hypothetical protein
MISKCDIISLDERDGDLTRQAIVGTHFEIFNVLSSIPETSVFEERWSACVKLRQVTLLFVCGEYSQTGRVCNTHSRSQLLLMFVEIILSPPHPESDHVQYARLTLSGPEHRMTVVSISKILILYYHDIHRCFTTSVIVSKVCAALCTVAPHDRR